MINATAASVLGFLVSGPKSGWELNQEIELSVGNFWNVTRSQVYRELTTLAAAGLVRAGEVGRRDRRPYEITDSGREAFVEWINREPGPELLRSPLLLTVFFSEHLDPERYARFLALHRTYHERDLDKYETLYAQIGGLPGGPIDTLRFGIAYERAYVDWIVALQSRLPERAESVP